MRMIGENICSFSCAGVCFSPDKDGVFDLPDFAAVEAMFHGLKPASERKQEQEPEQTDIEQEQEQEPEQHRRPGRPRKA